MLKITKIFIKRTWIYMKWEYWFILCGILMLCILSMSQYLDEEIFSGLLLFSGVAFLNGLTKNLNYENLECFNINQL